MRLPGFQSIGSKDGVFGLCLCLVLVCLISVAGAQSIAPHDVYSAESSTAGKPPLIQLFKADPMVLSDGNSALYTFIVKDASKIQVIEAGNIIKDIDNPTLATLNGTVTGLPGNAIQMGDGNTFVTVLTASNGGVTVNKELTLSFTAPAPPTGSTDNQTQPRSPKWLPQLPSPSPLTSSTSAKPGSEPVFFKCPVDCQYCLNPEDAASRGFGQQCSNQPCYYSPDNQQKWYCYKPIPGWCCAGGQVGQSTKDQCAQVGGYWSTNQDEAIQACQPTGYCCLYGQIDFPTTQAQCAQMGGSYWSTDQAQTMQVCQPMCWCCAGGKVYQTTQAQCAQMGGTCYATQAQALESCRQTAPTTPRIPTYLR